MSFHDVRLPPDVERGAQGGPGFKTTVIELANGKEKRNINWSQARARYNVAYGIMRRADYKAVLTFFYARRGKAHSFRFKDWSDFEMPRQNIGTGTGSEDEYQIFRRYSSGSQNYDRIIEKPVAGTVQVWVNNVLLTITTDYTVNLLTGLITFVTPPTSGHAIEVACEFDVPCRFDKDEMETELEWYDAGTIPDINIVEVRGE